MHLVFLAALVAVALFLYKLFGREADRKAPKLFRAKPLLTGNEKEFFSRLRAALPGYTVITQVSMGALMAAIANAQQSHLALRGRFAQKIVDFVVLDDDYNVVALIELDDRSHNAEKDARRDAMTRQAGYVTLRYDSRDKPSADRIRQDIKSIKKPGRR